MKKKLLFLAFILLVTLKGFSQATAYPVPDVNVCDSEVFDFTVQTPIVLGNQDPALFTVTYYLSEADAINNTNALVNPTVFSQGSQQIFVKVINTLDNSSDITFFTLNLGEGVVVPDWSDVQACDAYELPALPIGKYYTGPGGTGIELVFGTMITQTQVVYIYAENDFGCKDESDFMVIINLAPSVNEPEPLYGCVNSEGVAIFDLTQAIPQIVGNATGYVCTFHHTQTAAEFGVNAIANIEAYYPAGGNIVYVSVVQSGTVTNCRTIVALELISIECNGNTLSGYASFDFDGDCETFEVAASGIPVYLTHGNDVYISYTNANGYYHFENVPDGASSVHTNTALSSSVSPSSYAVVMPGNLTEQNFCITYNGESISDTAVNVFPISAARSGFLAGYAIVYQNMGTVTQNGNITLEFDTNNLTFSGAEPAMIESGNMLTFSYTNLYPSQTKVVTVYFTVNVPQITPDGTVLNFTANITPTTGDVNITNNTSVISQTVVNSMDPNDITVREGKSITEAQADDYLHYTIRFQNKGTANAENVRIVVGLDENLDWSTFEALSGSDAFTVKRTGDNFEFMFAGIDLAFENEDTGVIPESNGHIIYRIKPKASVTLGDEMSAVANIYFDFNDPIETNEVTTKVENVTGLNENGIDSFTVYPNPASANVNLMVVNADNGFNVTVIDMLGKTVIKNSFITNEASLDISALNSGIYFISMTADGRQSTKKLIVK